MGIQFQTCDILRYCKRTFKGTIRIPLVVKKIIPRQNVGQMSNASYGRYVSRNTLKCRIPVAERRESRRAFLSSSKKGFIVTDTRHSTLLRWNSVVRVYVVSAVILLPFYRRLRRPSYNPGENKPTDRLERLSPPRWDSYRRRRILLSVERMEFFPIFVLFFFFFFFPLHWLANISPIPSW